MCDTCNQAQVKGAGTRSNKTSNVLFDRKYRLERELEEVNEAIKLVENDEAVRKVIFVTEQMSKS